MVIDMEKLRAIVERLTFVNDQNGYSVIKVKVAGVPDLVTVVGKFAGINAGSAAEFQGKWIIDPKYGKQFSASAYRETMPATLSGIEKYLGSGLIKGIGPANARRIVRYFREDTLRVIDDEPRRLAEIPGVGEKRVEMIIAAWREHREIKNVMLFLQDHGVSTAYATKIFRAYGNRSIEIVKQNPYQLADDIWGIGFITADKIAQKMGIDPASEQRCRAGLVYALNKFSDDGHCYALKGDLAEKAAAMLGAGDELVEASIAALISEERIICEGGDKLYLPAFYHSEANVSKRIAEICGCAGGAGAGAAGAVAAGAAKGDGAGAAGYAGAVAGGTGGVPATGAAGYAGAPDSAGDAPMAGNSGGSPMAASGGMGRFADASNARDAAGRAGGAGAVAAGAKAAGGTGGAPMAGRAGGTPSAVAAGSAVGAPMAGRAGAAGARPFDGAGVEDVIRWTEADTGVIYDDIQKNAVRCAVQSKFMVLTGGPGTGKTTTTCAIINACERMGAKVMLAAPTGRAAKRMSETTGREAKTIHRLLEMRPPDGYKRNKDNPLPCDVLIIDEASMLDIILTNSLLKAVRPGASVILVGDADQLPSVGPGNVLKDVINSHAVPCVELKRIFRQARSSDIVTNAHKINAGEFPFIKNSKSTDFFFIEKNEPSEVAKTILSLCKERLPNYYRADPLEDIQVLCPMTRGETGSASLNAELQGLLNGGRESVRYGAAAYMLGDKVMQIRNNYDKNVFNGDIGRITGIDAEERSVTITFDGNCVEYDLSELDEVALAYAITVHKSQGSEYPIVVCPVTTQHFMMLQKNLLYTAITRAKKVLVLVGSKKALAIAVKNKKSAQRNTLLAERLRRDAGAP
jgi:exodeoxyribonuclease V alpha subunit